MPDITIEAASPGQSIPTDPTRVWPGSPPRFDSDRQSSGNWSTVSTPGIAGHRTFDLSTGPPPSDHDPRKATVSGELEGLPEQPATPEKPSFGDPNTRLPAQLPSHPPEPGSILPSEVVPAHIETHTVAPIDSAVNTPLQPPIQSRQQISTPIPIQQPPPQAIRNITPPPPPAPVPPPQLTPKQIAQAQKHCRYAISALDYEDFERARQDLLDALKIIGGQVPRCESPSHPLRFSSLIF